MIVLSLFLILPPMTKGLCWIENESTTSLNK